MHFHVCCKRLYALEISQGKAFINYLLLVHLFALKGLALPTLQSADYHKHRITTKMQYL
ncbi:hypothetical protein NIES2098_12180 [Calothrix sp. NIES-2098]|nr:hypothetical protein NIES2098_12180 [Calothrix sp. NIES-2098]